MAKALKKPNSAGSGSTAEAADSRQANIRQPLVRRVLKMGGYLVCGLCRRRYGRLAEAQGCLLSCWNVVLRSYPLIPRQTGYKPTTGIDSLQSVYRCRFCSRDYFTEKEGLACAQRCLKNCHDRMQAVHDLPAPPPIVKEQRDFASDHLKVKMKYISRYNFKRKQPEVEEPIEVEIDVPIVDSGDPHSYEGYQPKSVEGNDKPKEERNKDFYPKPFLRQNAKYRCAYCLTDFFTKMEVEECFDSHFDDQGREIDPNGAATAKAGGEDEEDDIDL